MEVTKKVTGSATVEQVLNLLQALTVLHEDGESYLDAVTGITVETRDGLQLKLDRPQGEFQVSVTWEVVTIDGEGETHYELNPPFGHLFGLESKYTPKEAKLVRTLFERDPFAYQRKLLT